MARQTFYIAKAQPHPLYKTRMLQAGPIELDASAARLYRQLGVKLKDEDPKAAAKTEAPAPQPTETTVAPKPKARRKAKAKK